MTHSEWLEQHGFTKVKDNKVGDWSYKTYQKVYENGDILEIYIEETDTPGELISEYMTGCELFCKNTNGTHDSMSIV